MPCRAAVRWLWRKDVRKKKFVENKRAAGKTRRLQQYTYLRRYADGCAPRDEEICIFLVRSFCRRDITPIILGRGEANGEKKNARV